VVLFQPPPTDNRFPTFQNVRENCSFAPPGLVPVATSTQGLRPGLHSFAASRLRRAYAAYSTSDTLPSMKVIFMSLYL
jgi:hypothetical protein